MLASVVSFVFCNLTGCYSLVLYFYKNIDWQVFIDIVSVLYCIIFPFHSAICGVILGPYRLHCKKKKRAMHTKYGVLRLSHLEHLIWREVTPNFWCVFYTKLSVLSHQLSVLSH